MIDWPTVIAQIINFLILVYLLKRFLYGRIVAAMDKRQQRIAAQLQQAADARKEADQQAESFRSKLETLLAQRKEMFAKAKDEAAAHRQQLMDQARQEVDALHARWREALGREQAAFVADLRERVSRQTLAIARRALGDLAGAGLEATLVDAFLQRLPGLPEEERKAIAPLPDQEQRIVVRSAFEIPEDRRGPIRDAIHAHVAEGLDVAFETSPEVLCGIELLAGGRKLAWSMDNYLDRLEEDLREALEQQPPPEALKQEIEKDVEKDKEQQAPEPEEKEPPQKGEGEEPPKDEKAE